MSTKVHFIDVGQGNMVLIQTESGRNYIFDCNITEDNDERVLNYMANQVGEGQSIKAFICSHRDADHMRGIKKLHSRFPIGEIWDSGYPGTTTDSSEYKVYMDLRRRLGSRIIKKETYKDYGRTRFRYLSAQDSRLPANANAQGIVIKVEHRSTNGSYALSSAMLTADSDAQTWSQGIMADYSRRDVSSSILMGAHHGSISFFDDPEQNYYYTDHLESIAPDMTIISVGNNPHGHPNDTALSFYRKYSNGSESGNKVYRTDTKGTMKLTLKNGSGWFLATHQ